MAAVVVTAYCRMTCSLAIASLHLGILFWNVINGSKLKCLDISIVFVGLLTSKVNSGVIVRINRLAKVDGVLQLLTEHPLTRVPRHLQKKEAGVGFRQVVVWGRVFVKHLKRRTRRILSLYNPLILLKAKWEQIYNVRDRPNFSQLYLILFVDDMVNVCEVFKRC